MNYQKAEIYVAKLKEDWPAPSRALSSISPTTGGYCVGGAYLHSRRSIMSKISDWLHGLLYGPTPLYLFPSYGEIAKALQEDNEDLSWIAADFAAQALVTCNDCGDYKTAWLVLERALGWHKGQGSLIDSIMTTLEAARRVNADSNEKIKKNESQLMTVESDSCRAG